MNLTRAGARPGARKSRHISNAGADVADARPTRHAADCRLDQRDWETLAKYGRGDEAVASVLRLTLASARAALDAARERLREKDVAKQRS